MGKLIDADVLMAWFSYHYDDEDVSVGYVTGIIEELPEAVVRCRDCKFYGEMLPKKDTRMICHKIYLNTRPDDFCSHGERRTDE